MTVKKTLKIFSILLSLSMPLSGLHAEDAAAPEKPARIKPAERKAALAALVETRPNGDVVIMPNPASDMSLASKSPKMPEAVMELMLHIDPELNFDKFNKSIMKNAAGTGDVRIRETMAGCDDYLSALGFGIKRIKFNPGTIRGRINAGIPFFIAVYNKDGWDAKLSERSQRRPKDGDWKEWKTSLRKETLKGNPKGVIGRLEWCLVKGYNKESGEFMVKVKGRDIWMAEPEIKLLQHSFYEVR